jgi:hypothetical protein
VKVPLVGPVRAGKSTYIAALYNAFSSGESTSGIRFDAEPTVRERLLKLHTPWLSCQEVPRTVDSGPFEFPLGTVSLRGHRKVELVVPDRAGESFLDQWVRRYLEPDYVDAVAEAAGILAFLHPGHVHEVRRIDDTMHELTALLSDDGPSSTGEPVDGGRAAQAGASEGVRDEIPSAPIEDWQADLAPTEVVLVELLQFVDDLRGKQPVPIGLIVSAWDTVAKLGLSPQGWLAEYMPLLTQYLDSRSKKGAAIRVYGASATGGNIRDADDRKRLLCIADASQRPFIVSEEGTQSHDLSAPLLPFLAN